MKHAAPAAPHFLLRDQFIAGLAIFGIALHLVFRFLPTNATLREAPLLLVLLIGGSMLVVRLVRQVLEGEVGADVLAGISIVTSLFLDEYLAGSLVVLMLSGGESLEQYAATRASSVLKALAARMPNIAHRATAEGTVDVPLDSVRPGDELVIFPHETCPVDGEVLRGHGTMDESYLTGEPYYLSKTPGSAVVSGAVNGETVLHIRANALAVDSRYAKIVEILRRAEEERPRFRRLADQLGGYYTVFAVLLASGAWWLSADPLRFLAVLVVATPCPLIIAIPVAIIGAISLSARRGIIIRDPAVLEAIANCKTAIFDKTGTLTYGEPRLEEELVVPGLDPDELLSLAATIERYSKHPLAKAVRDAAAQRGVPLQDAEHVAEPPGQGLKGIVGGKTLQITGRTLFGRTSPAAAAQLPPAGEGLECILVLDGRYAATYRFRDAPREDTREFVKHLGPKHGFTKVMLVSGDRESEVRYLAGIAGIEEIHANASPEDKVEIVRRETAHAPTLFIGDGVNDAPALVSASAGIAFGRAHDVTSEAAGAVLLDPNLRKVDELLHISLHMRRIALQSAVGGMVLSTGGMFFAAFGLLTPVAGALVQEIIDVVSIVNALRSGRRPEKLSDF